MKKVLLSCMAVAMGMAIAVAQDESYPAAPAYPTTLDFTLNGEKELPGVSVTQTMVPYDGSEYLSIEITGESDANDITMDFTTPEGWDYTLIHSQVNGGDSPFKTRSDESDNWIELKYASGYKKGNSFKFPVNGKESLGTIYLVKGDYVWAYSIDVSLKVSKSEGSGDSSVLQYPDALNLTLNGEKELPGVSVKQELVPFDGEDYLTVTISGECDAKEITLDIATPEGWDGMLTFSEYGESGDIEPLKAKAPAKEGDDYWTPLMFAEWMGLKPGNTITFPVDGEEHQAMACLVKGDAYYTIQIDFVFDVKKSSGSGDEPVDPNNPSLPKSLKYTLNGETELPGITVKQQIDDTYHLINITGECDSDKITVTFDTPEGWDGLMIADFFGCGEISNLQTRGEVSMIPVENILGMGFQKGNTITYDTDGEANIGYIALIKGDMACSTFIDFEITVSKSGGSDQPGLDGPAFPESIGVTTFAEGLEVWQGEDYDILTIILSGEIAQESFDVVLDVPEGWDGFISAAYSDDTTIGESGVGPRKTRAEEIEWYDIEAFIDAGYVKGNKFTFKANGTQQDVEIHLYKGNMVDAANWIALENNEVTSTGGNVEPIIPVFPETFELTVDSQNVSVWQGGIDEIDASGISLTEDELEVLSMFMPEKAIVLNGSTEAENVTVDFDLPEGWLGVLPVKVNILAEDDYNLLSTRANDFEPYPLNEFLDQIQMMGIFETPVEPGNPLVFPTNEKKQVYGCYLYMYDDGTLAGDPEFAGYYLDMANSFVIVVNVESKTSSVESINTIDSNATYYDVTGKKIANPTNGIFVKIVDGKASKVIVK